MGKTDKKEKFLYMSNAAYKVTEMCQQNNIELLGVMTDRKTRQSAMISNTNEPGFMLFLLNCVVINHYVEQGVKFEEMASLVMTAASSAINSEAHKHIWNRTEKDDEE